MAIYTKKIIRGIVAGSFDVIHPGYIKMFQDSKNVCDYLIVALQSDPTIDRPDTKTSPIFSLEERILILSSIKYIDEIISYTTEEDLYILLKQLEQEQMVDIRILGTDYIDKSFTGDDLKISIYYHNRDHDWSSSNVRQLIKDNND
jgi:glycerol-3-phosphate cytidylyltransferase